MLLVTVVKEYGARLLVKVVRMPVEAVPMAPTPVVALAVDQISDVKGSGPAEVLERPEVKVGVGYGLSG